jgi:outer membrane biogenesis lipoprotein LolB
MRTQRGRFPTAPFLFPLLLVACSAPRREAPANAQEQQVIWNTIRSWSGSGDEQLDSFTSDTGALRIDWEAKSKENATTPGMFRVAIHSAISGRPLTVPIDQRGAGRGTSYVTEEPRVFFADINSYDVEWKITISERLR